MLAVPSSISLLQRGSSNVARHLFDDMHSSCMSQFIAAASSSTGAGLQQRPWIPSASRPQRARRKVTASSNSDALRCVALARSGHPPSICAVPVAMPSTHGETPRVRLNGRTNKSYNKLCCARSPCRHASRIPCSTKPQAVDSMRTCATRVGQVVRFRKIVISFLFMIQSMA
jgi:hypothetical protein